MSTQEIRVILKRFESPDEVRTMEKGKFELVHIGGITIGRATYEPGWKWSEHVGLGVGATRCPVEHVGLVISELQPLRSTMVEWSSSNPAIFSTFRQSRTIVGSSEISRTSRFTFSAPKSTRPNNR